MLPYCYIYIAHMSLLLAILYASILVNKVYSTLMILPREIKRRKNDGAGSGGEI